MKDKLQELLDLHLDIINNGDEMEAATASLVAIGVAKSMLSLDFLTLDDYDKIAEDIVKSISRFNQE